MHTQMQHTQKHNIEAEAAGVLSLLAFLVQKYKYRRAAVAAGYRIQDGPSLERGSYVRGPKV
jgi:hypothetical protein